MKENNQRRYPGVLGRRPDNKKHKQEEAKERQLVYNKLSTRDKLLKLSGWTATKQRARLSEQLKKEKAA